MTAVRSDAGRALALHPSARGFGWVVFESPFLPIDWGLASARGDKNAVCRQRLDRLLCRFQPEVLVLEAYGDQTSRRSRRIGLLCASLQSMAEDRGVEVLVYARAEVREAFAEVKARTRREIAEAVARHLDVFRHRLPSPRRPWESEDARDALFAAAALAFTHYRLCP